MHHTPHQLFTDVHKLVDRLSVSFPGIKIILSEVTPRMDNFDTRVKEINVLLRQYVKGKDKLFLTKNSNLRNRDFFLADGIHLNQSITPRFASNIKSALCAAYGIQRYDRRSPPSHQSTSPFQKSVDSENRSATSQRLPNSWSSSTNIDTQLSKSPHNRSLIESLQNELLLRLVRSFQFSGT